MDQTNQSAPGNATPPRFFWTATGARPSAAPVSAPAPQAAPPVGATSPNGHLHNFIGRVLKALAGPAPTNYDVDRTTGRLVASSPQESPSQKIRRITNNALAGLSAGSAIPDQKSGLASALAGLGAGAGAVRQQNQEQDLLKRKQAREDFEQEQQATLHKVNVARLNALTLSTYFANLKLGNDLNPQYEANRKRLYDLKAANVPTAIMSADEARQKVAGDKIDEKFVLGSSTIEMHETRAVPLPPDFSARVDDWFPDGSHLLVSRTTGPGKASLWSISIFGGAPRQLAIDAMGGSVSPDGAHIAFMRGDLSYVGLLAREHWVMNSDGTDAVKVTSDRTDGSWVSASTWSPDGEHLAYVRTIWSFDAPKSFLEINEWEKKTEETLFSNDHLDLALHWLPDGRLIYALSSLQPMQDSSLWAVKVQKGNRSLLAPRQIAGENGWIPRIKGRADGKTLVLLRGNRSPSVYIGTLSADGARMVSHERLTLDETMNLPFSWTSDSKAVFFNSTRNGIPVIFKQSIGDPLADVLVKSPDQVSQPRLTPDGSEIAYISTPGSGEVGVQSSIFAVPIDGGPPRLILKDTDIYAVECAKAPSTTCLYSIKKGENLETFRFDAKSGKRAEGSQIDPYCNWSLSPDGSQRAIVRYGANVATIQLRSTTTGKSRELVISGWEGLKNIDWSADGRSLYVAWHDFQRDSALLNVSLDGRVSVVVRSSNPEVFYAIPSPNGRMLAITEAHSTQNVWQIENF